jgi:hypothetical protein
MLFCLEDDSGVAVDTDLPVLAEVMLLGQGRGLGELVTVPVFAQVQLCGGRGFGLPVLAEVQLCKGGQVSEGLLGHLATGQRTIGL